MLAKEQIHHSAARCPCTQTNHAANCYFRSSENQLEDIVEDKVAALSIGEKLESLAVVHWSLLLVDLDKVTVSLLIYNPVVVTAL
jgi:hypothetical protein